MGAQGGVDDDSHQVLGAACPKAVQGMKAEDAVKWASGELKKIYG